MSVIMTKAEECSFREIIIIIIMKRDEEEEEDEENVEDQRSRKKTMMFVILSLSVLYTFLSSCFGSFKNEIACSLHDCL